MKAILNIMVVTYMQPTVAYITKAYRISCLVYHHSCAGAFETTFLTLPVINIEHIGTKVIAVLFGRKGAQSLPSLCQSPLSKFIVLKIFCSSKASTPNKVFHQISFPKIYYQIMVWIRKDVTWILDDKGQ